MNETDPNVPFARPFAKGPTVYGTRIPPGFNGSQKEMIDTLLEMASATIQENKLYYGWAMTLERSPAGEWRFAIIPKEKYART